MKYGKSDVRGKAGPGPGIRFELRSLTPYPGPVSLRHLFSRLGIRERLPDVSTVGHSLAGADEESPTLKTHCRMDYVPVGTLVGNQLHMFPGILARNPTRELRIRLAPRARGTTPKRTAPWRFREMGTLRRNLIRRSGRIIRPAGKSVLPMNGSDGREGEFRHALKVLNAAT